MTLTRNAYFVGRHSYILFTLAEALRSSIARFTLYLQFCTKHVFDKGTYLNLRGSYYSSLLSAGKKNLMLMKIALTYTIILVILSVSHREKKKNYNIDPLKSNVYEYLYTL